MYAWFYAHQPLITGALVGLVLFIGVFTAVVVRQLLPGARERGDADARLALEGDER